MKKFYKRIMTIMIVIVVMVGSSYSFLVAAKQEDKVSMNLDVVFVIDASGSMKRDTDPERIALDACNLFVDECDDTCGVGYVVYTHKIKAAKPITKLNSSSRKSLKNEIASIQYDDNGNTDIALGVTKAMSFLQQSEKDNKNRKRAIILLSDGNTYLTGSKRTKAVSEKELKNDTEQLARKSIPVHTIGLNKDGSLDKKEIESISSKTKGLSYITKTADSLPGIVNKIIAEYLNTKNKTLQGNMDFVIENRSIYAVYISIYSGKSIKQMNPILTSPSGHQISLNGNNVTTTKGKSYWLIKLFTPDIGEWNLKLKGVSNSDCKVELTTVYSMYLKQVVKSTSVAGDKISIVANINNADGVVQDKDLLKTLSVKSHISGAEKKTVNLMNDGKGNFRGSFIAAKNGSYTVVSKATSSDKTFNRQSETFNFEVADPMNNDSIAILQSVSEDEVQSGNSIDISVEVKNSESNKIISLADSVFTTSISDKDGKKIADVALKKGKDKKYKGSYTFEEQGEYNLVTSVVENNTGTKKKSNESFVVVTRPNMKLKGEGNINVSVRSNPLSTSETFLLNDYIVSDPKDILTIEFLNSEENVYEISEIDDSGKKAIEVKGKSEGSGSSTVTVKNQYGENAVIHVNVDVTNSWSDIFLYVGITIAILILFFIIYLLIRPKLSGTVELSLNMPSNLAGYAPGGSQRKPLPRRHKVKLGDVFRRMDNDFVTALSKSGIEKDVKNITVTAKFRGDAVIKGSGRRQINNYSNKINKVTVTVKYKKHK